MIHQTLRAVEGSCRSVGYSQRAATRAPHERVVSAGAPCSCVQYTRDILVIEIIWMPHWLKLYSRDK
eukprot:7856376-Heterocapsa_arctica.AAC.1